MFYKITSKLKVGATAFFILLFVACGRVSPRNSELSAPLGGAPDSGGDQQQGGDLDHDNAGSNSLSTTEIDLPARSDCWIIARDNEISLADLEAELNQVPFGLQLFTFASSPPRYNDSAAQIFEYGGSQWGWWNNGTELARSARAPKHFTLRTPRDLSGPMRLRVGASIEFAECTMENPMIRPWARITPVVLPPDQDCAFEFLEGQERFAFSEFTELAGVLPAASVTDLKLQILAFSDSILPREMSDVSFVAALMNDPSRADHWANISNPNAEPLDRSLLPRRFVIRTHGQTQNLVFNPQGRVYSYGCTAINQPAAPWNFSIAWGNVREEYLDFYFRSVGQRPTTLADIHVSEGFKSKGLLEFQRHAEVHSSGNQSYFVDQNWLWRQSHDLAIVEASQIVLSQEFFIRSFVNDQDPDSPVEASIGRTRQFEHLGVMWPGSQPFWRD